MSETNTPMQQGGNTEDMVRAGFADIYDFDEELLHAKFDSAYMESVEEFREKYAARLGSFEKICLGLPDAKSYIKETADYIVSLEFNKESAIKSKNSRGMRNIDGALYTVMYILPVFSEWTAEPVRELADAISKAWPEKFGGEPLGIVKTERMAIKFHGNWMKKIFKLLGLTGK